MRRPAERQRSGRSARNSGGVGGRARGSDGATVASASGVTGAVRCPASLRQRDDWGCQRIDHRCTAPVPCGTLPAVRLKQRNKTMSSEPPDSDLADLEHLRKAIRENHMMESWKDSLFEKTEEEQIQRARKRALEARDTFLRIMNSTKNDGTLEYQQWAIRTALGLPTRAHRASGKAFSKRPNRSLA